MKIQSRSVYKNLKPWQVVTTCPEQFVICDFPQFHPFYRRVDHFHKEYGRDIEKFLPDGFPVPREVYSRLVAYTHTFLNTFGSPTDTTQPQAELCTLSGALDSNVLMCMEHALLAQYYLRKHNLNSYLVTGHINEVVINRRTSELAGHALIVIRDDKSGIDFVFDANHSVQLSEHRYKIAGLPLITMLDAGRQSIDQLVKNPGNFGKLINAVHTDKGYSDMSLWYGNQTIEPASRAKKVRDNSNYFIEKIAYETEREFHGLSDAVDNRQNLTELYFQNKAHLKKSFNIDKSKHEIDLEKLPKLSKKTHIELLRFLAIISHVK